MYLIMLYPIKPTKLRSNKKFTLKMALRPFVNLKVCYKHIRTIAANFAQPRQKHVPNLHITAVFAFVTQFCHMHDIYVHWSE